jgi:hypothetical protein
MNRAILAAALAITSLVGTAGLASAACTYGAWTGYNTQMNGSYGAGYYECTVGSWAGTFKARTWMHGTCVLGSGCRSSSIQRSDALCAYPGIGVHMQGNHVNYSTGVVTQNKDLAINNNSVCGSSITISQPAPHQWLLGVRCRVGHTC